MKSAKIRIAALCCLILGAGVWLASCGGGGGGASSTPTGSVGLFMTDAPQTGDGFTQISALVNSVTLLNTGSGASCTVFSNAASPLEVNFADLSNVVELVKTSNCQAGSFNRIELGFSNAVGVSQGGLSNACAFISSGQPNQPNTMSCSGNTCTMDINGAVNSIQVLANKNNQVGLDFDLRHSTVTGFGTSACTVALTVSPLDASGLNGKGFPSSVSGTISAAVGNTVTINTGTRYFTINAGAGGQTGLSQLMQFARQNGFPALANCTGAGFDFDAGTCQASEALATVSGTVSGLSNTGSTYTFTLTPKSGPAITVSVPTSAVEGALGNGGLAVAKVSSFNNTGTYSASQVESFAGMGPLGTLGASGMPDGGMPMM